MNGPDLSARILFISPDGKLRFHVFSDDIKGLKPDPRVREVEERNKSPYRLGSELP